MPLSEDAVITEYLDLSTHPVGEIWFTVTTVVDSVAKCSGPCEGPIFP